MKFVLFYIIEKILFFLFDVLVKIRFRPFNMNEKYSKYTKSHNEIVSRFLKIKRVVELHYSNFSIDDMDLFLVALESNIENIRFELNKIRDKDKLAKHVNYDKKNK